MDSFYAQLYLDLQNRIATMVPEIVFIEQNFGQYQNEDFNIFPSVLIDFPFTSYSALQGLNQIATPTINLMLLFAAYSNSYNIAPEEVKKNALEYFEIERKLVKAIHGWENGFCSPLIRVNDKNHNQNDRSLRVRDLNFSTEFEDMIEEEPQHDVIFKIIGSIEPKI
ncbi:hypothetical protein [Flavobacterium sp. '19STA2R22 D10 B1']|uniref:hypothetical protein n=1 Tax=Flavobacterium aerium TaxID=3037261 RepID=UPI00278BB680|nr:hypothetical protein [Flavobacterium sp. '19STA2R22 D10 B1']